MHSYHDAHGHPAQCSGKRPYASFKEANRAARALMKRAPSGDVKAYQCGCCRAFHIGRLRKRLDRRT